MNFSHSSMFYILLLTVLPALLKTHSLDRARKTRSVDGEVQKPDYDANVKKWRESYYNKTKPEYDDKNETKPDYENNDKDNSTYDKSDEMKPDVESNDVEKPEYDNSDVKNSTYDKYDEKKPYNDKYDWKNSTYDNYDDKKYGDKDEKKPNYDNYDKKLDDDKEEKKPKYEDQHCNTAHPKMHSYHIHVLFWLQNSEHIASALTLRGEVIEKFGLEGKRCDINRGDPGPGHPMCWYDVTMEPEPPFPTGEFSFFVPFPDFQRVSEWILQRRGLHDVFIHPNTGCELHDHLKWSVWSGNKWPLDASIFTCHYPGCVPLRW